MLIVSCKSDSSHFLRLDDDFFVIMLIGPNFKSTDLKIASTVFSGIIGQLGVVSGSRSNSA